MLAHVQEHREVTAELCAGPALEAMRVRTWRPKRRLGGRGHVDVGFNFAYTCQRSVSVEIDEAQRICWGSRLF